MKHADFVLPDLSGKVIFVTGGTAGMGEEAAKQFAAGGPARIYISGRNAARAGTAIQEIRAKHPKVQVEFVKMDLASLGSVAGVAEQLLASGLGRIDILLCNAGIMMVPAAVSADGYEVQFATNHLGHALLIKKLTPLLLATAERHGDARVISLASTGFQLAPKAGIIFKDLGTAQESISTSARYGQSKLANVLYMAELARRQPKLVTASIQPGMVMTGLVDNTGFWTRMLIYAVTVGQKSTPAEGAVNGLWAATAAKEDVKSGAFYEPVAKPGKTNKHTEDRELAGQLWKWTEEALQKY